LGNCTVGLIYHPVFDWSKCGSQIESVFEDILANAKPGDVVWFASLRTQRFVDQGAGKVAITTHNVKEQWLKDGYQEFRSLIPRFTKSGLTILIDRPKPVFKAEPFRCSDWFNKYNAICKPGFKVKKSELNVHSSGVNQKIDLLREEFNSVIAWDPSEVLCGSKACKAIKDGKPLFLDADHLSRYGNLILVKSLENALR